MDQTPDPAVTQLVVPGVHDLKAQLTANKGSLTNIKAALLYLLHGIQNSTPLAPAPATLAPAVGTDFTTFTPTAKLVLQLNPPAIFNGD
jgi:hypothetical protein